MVRRVVVDVLIGAGMAVVGQLVLLLSTTVGRTLGLPFPYFSATSRPSSSGLSSPACGEA